MELEKVKKRLLNGIEVSNEGCWVWKKGCFDHKYGCIRVKDKMCLAHRISWVIFKGEIPEGLFVLHKCDVTRCINPEHLFLGTQQDNMDDMYRKGRQGKQVVREDQRGKLNNMSKLKEEDVKEIKRLLNKGELTNQKIADRFHVSQSQISGIKNNKFWSHLKEED